MHRSKALVLTDLSIEDGSFAWKLCMDLVCLSYDGNLADAALVAAVSALMRLQLPGTRRIDDEIFITEGEDRGTDTSGACTRPLANDERVQETHSSRKQRRFQSFVKMPAFFACALRSRLVRFGGTVCFNYHSRLRQSAARAIRLSDPVKARCCCSAF